MVRILIGAAAAFLLVGFLLIPVSIILWQLRPKKAGGTEKNGAPSAPDTDAWSDLDAGLILLTADKRIAGVNPAACRMLELADDSFNGCTLAEAGVPEEIADAIERESAAAVSLDGRAIQLHTARTREGLAGFLFDVTEKNESDRLRREFTANVSHELKTPLTSISGYAELIESGMAMGEDVTLFAGRIRRESARMLALISDILKLSRLDEEADGADFGPVELYSLCAECMDVLEMSARRHSVTVTLDGEPCTVNGNAGELTELVYNLIDNSIRYNRPGGSVKLTITSPDPDTAVLTVSDTGIGIPAEHQSRVFERFYRVDKSRSKETGGTGLGLAIVKHVAERHHARLELRSRPEEGTTVKITFRPMQDGIME